MQEDDVRTRDITPSSSHEVTKTAEGYESCFEFGRRDSIKEKRIRSRFESIDVAAIMGKSKKNRNVNRRMEREGMKTDALQITDNITDSR